MLTTHMDPQLTGSDVVTTEDGHLLTLNQVMELGKIEHKFKPTIMKKEFNWDLPADPDPKSDNYYNGIVSKELKDSSNVAEVLLGVIRRESVINQSDFVNEGIETILDRLGIKSDKPLTRKEKTSSSRKPLSLYEKYTNASVQAKGVRLLLKWYTSSPSKHFSLKRLKKFQYLGKIDYI